MALRHGLVVGNPNQVTLNSTGDIPEDKYPPDYFHHHSHPADNPQPLPDDFISLYAMRRDRLAATWKTLEKSMAAAFFACQYHTKNWTTTTTYLEPLERCTCTRTSKRAVDLIHTHERFPQQPVEFCACIPDAIRLIHLGYIAASPSKPRTAFSIPLIQLYQSLWHESALPYTSFIGGIMYHQDRRSRQVLHARGRKNNTRDLRIPFSQANDAFQRILTLEKELLITTLGLTIQDQWASRCPSCFGTEPDSDSENGEAYAIIAMDGNFQHRHHKFASTDVPEEADYPPNFIPPSKVLQHENHCLSTDTVANELKTSCSDAHKAANDVRNSTSWDKFDDTGLFGSCCRHDIPLKLANIYQTGEKLFYPISIISNLLESFPTKRFGILYDIGCHLDAHVQKRQLLGSQINHVVFGTSVFHAYVHNWECQVKYNPRYNNHWGLSDGEGMERLWSQLSDMVGPLRNATRFHRLQAIGHQCNYYSEKLKIKAGDWTQRHFQQAMDTIDECEAKLANIYGQPNPFSDPPGSYNQEFFQAQWALERDYYRNRNDQQVQKRLELGRLLSLEEDLNNAWDNLNHNSDDALARVRTMLDIQQKIQLARNQIGSDEFLDGVEPDHVDLFLKVWWAKTELRKKYFALMEEKRPLDAVRMGIASKLGTDGKEKLIISLRKKIAALKTTVNTYNLHLDNFHKAFPDRPTLAPAVYDSITQMAPDDPFWNDGVFTNHDEPWATDPDTQDGMRLVARLSRALEEVRRIGREIRRALRWAVTEHNRIIPLMFGLTAKEESVLTRLQPGLNHPVLRTLSQNDQIDCVKAILHNHFIRLSSTQLQWDQKFIKLFSTTGPYENDADLLRDWEDQILRLSYLKQCGHLSMVGGDFDNAIGCCLDGIEESVMRDFVAASDANRAVLVSDEADGEELIDENMVENMPVVIVGTAL
ncbi:hypothetical protein PCASD_23365 [Puccinia coronata f. sp. avenae]|uniref:CxC1-like cysteine cluster associated with KDZ transposases domain-containing protein n=1 Tax=Puccinia coronata f. sp. avenae TaxID=200324 RepID=A0A2N5TJ64_9BASI|nr:hypothetical protein PCASD_23365 [Puccinia coronata f. sp. avenae]